MTDSQPLHTKPIASLHEDDSEVPQDAASLGHRISKALQGVQHGQITIMVHNSRVVQIDRMIRVRQFRSRKS